jgi:hypothetical protein
VGGFLDHRRRPAGGQTPAHVGFFAPSYYGAFLLDPGGHNVEAVNHNR